MSVPPRRRSNEFAIVLAIVHRDGQRRGSTSMHAQRRVGLDLPKIESMKGPASASAPRGGRSSALGWR